MQSCPCWVPVPRAAAPCTATGPAGHASRGDDAAILRCDPDSGDNVAVRLPVSDAVLRQHRTPGVQGGSVGGGI
jgi:hypothetical protein